MLFMMFFTTFSSCVGAERVETVFGLACQRIGLHGTDCESHVTRVLTWSDGTDFDTGLFLVFFWQGVMLRVRGSPADISSASRTCPC